MRIAPRRATKEEWETNNPILAKGELGIEVPDTGVGTGSIQMKIGDGTSRWKVLPYAVDIDKIEKTLNKLEGMIYNMPSGGTNGGEGTTAGPGTVITGGSVGRKIETTIPVSGWVGESAPYSNTLDIEQVTKDDIVDIMLTNDVTAEQVKAFCNATILHGNQNSGSITLYAWGEKPTIDLSILLIIRGSMLITKGYEIIKTLPAGETELVIEDDNIEFEDTVELYSDVYGVGPTSVNITKGKMVLTFLEQNADVQIKAIIK